MIPLLQFTLRTKCHPFDHQKLSKWEVSVQLVRQGSTLRRARMPGACKSCLRAHKHQCPTRQVIFQSGRVLIFLAVYKLYRACTKIGWAHEHFCRPRKFSEPCARRGINQMLNVKPCDENFMKMMTFPIQWRWRAVQAVSRLTLMAAVNSLRPSDTYMRQ